MNININTYNLLLNENVDRNKILLKLRDIIPIQIMKSPLLIKIY